MNGFVLIKNLAKLPSRYEDLTHINAIFDSRSGNIADQIVRFADVTIDVGRRRIMRNGEEVKVTPAEYNLLFFFVQNVDRALTRDAILNAAWGYQFYRIPEQWMCTWPGFGRNLSPILPHLVIS